MIIVIRVVFFVICSLITFFLYTNQLVDPILSVAIGAAAAVFVIVIDMFLRRVPTKELVNAAVGFIVGLALAFFVTRPIANYKIIEEYHVVIFLYLILGYLGASIALQKRDELIFGGAKALKGEKRMPDKILDTSVIIDGRIAEIVESGFLEGKLIIPRFVLQEVQYLADSQDYLKRNRGKRGLEILNKMQQNPLSNVKIYEDDVPEIKEVDEKLVAMAKPRGAKIITNDYNLNKVAKLQGVEILNINDLAGAVKAVVLPGELMTVKISKEGKESGQGLAYLDDGTMIVVEGGRNFMGQTVEVVVSSVLQTSSGKMIFSKRRSD